MSTYPLGVDEASAGLENTVGAIVMVGNLVVTLTTNVLVVVVFGVMDASMSVQ